MEMVEGLNGCYLRIEINEAEEKGMEGYRSRILQKNRVVGLLATEKRYIDGKHYFYYDVTGMKNLVESEAQIRVTDKQVEQLVVSMENLLQELEKYLLKSEEVSLLPEHIWQDGETERWYFLYLPEADEKCGKGARQFLEFIMDHLNCENDSGLERIYGFYSDCLQEKETLNMRKMVRIWNKQGQTALPRETKRVTEEETEAFQSEEWAEEEMTGPSAIKKRRIYQVPYHGTKIVWDEDATLT